MRLLSVLEEVASAGTTHEVSRLLLLSKEGARGGGGGGGAGRGSYAQTTSTDAHDALLLGTFGGEMTMVMVVRATGERQRRSDSR